MYKLFLTLRYLRTRRIAYFAIIAVTLCVTMVLVVMSVMGGFLDSIKQRSRGLLGDLVVDNKDYAGFPLYDRFIDEIRSWPEVVEATPVIYAWGLLRFPVSDHMAPVQVVGIRLQETYRVNAFKDSLYYEKHYPGTTTLGPMQQPVLGSVPPEDGRPGYYTLPEPFAEAWDRDVPNKAVPQTVVAQTMREAKRQPFPGVFRHNPMVPGMPLPAEMIDDPLPGLIIGGEIVAERNTQGEYKRFYPYGERVTLTLVAVSPVGTVDTPVKPEFRYAGDSLTRIYEIDSQHVYADFDLVQDLLLMGEAELELGGTAPARCSQIQVKINPGLSQPEILALAQRMEGLYHSYAADPNTPLPMYERDLIASINVKTWEQTQEQYIAPVEKERMLVTTLFAIISLVAAFLVLCILYMIVLQKTRDIGIIKAIGGSSAGVAAIFIFYGAAVGFVGAGLGTTLGYQIVTHINDVQNYLTRLNPSWQVWDRSVYSFDEIPHTVRTGEVVVVFCLSIVLSMVGSVLAAWRAGAMNPLEALRYE